MTEIDERTLEQLFGIGEILEKKFTQHVSHSDMKNSYSLLDNADVCFLLKISDRELYYLRKKSKIPYFRIDRRIYYKSSDIHEYITQSKMK